VSRPRRAQEFADKADPSQGTAGVGRAPRPRLRTTRPALRFVFVGWRLGALWTGLARGVLLLPYPFPDLIRKLTPTGD
jgi:hypothetical protein